MTTKAIHTEDQYHSYLDQVEELISKGDKLNSNEIDRLEVLTILIEAYENSKQPIEPLDPVDAILFRMEEKGLKQADLIPYFGTSSRVSEVLKRKRPLTVQMIRALSIGLGISAETLIGATDAHHTEKKELNWAKFPIKEIMQRGWLQGFTEKSDSSPESIIKEYIAGAGLQFGAASFRRTLSGEAESPTTKHAIYAWIARVIFQARKQKAKLGAFDRNSLDISFLRTLAQMSWSERGPLLAVEFLQKQGIAVVIENQLKGTQVDGAALQDFDGVPVIAMTLRYDRVDHFWFTLLHEVAHIWKHVSDDRDAFVDDFGTTSDDRREAEANRLAREAFIPRLLWRRSEAYLSPSREKIEAFAKELRIHPAIIVGRLHKENGDFSIFRDMLGQNEVRTMFLPGD